MGARCVISLDYGGKWYRMQFSVYVSVSRYARKDYVSEKKLTCVCVGSSQVVVNCREWLGGFSPCSSQGVSGGKHIYLVLL